MRDRVRDTHLAMNSTEPITKDESEHLVDGILLSDNGLSHLSKLLRGIDSNVLTQRKKKRAMSTDQGEQGILDSIESVIAAGVQGNKIAGPYFVEYHCEDRFVIGVHRFSS